ncbi:MAG: YqgE/AlgH family protein [Alphaproteobacteria bacterium]|nr:YqgE/AlgH family protein [Alphaproteobacteria bacterium]
MRSGRGGMYLLLTALLWAATPEAAPRTDVPRKPASLAGQLLIAAPTMPDPRFAGTVILMVRHDRSGALGIVINRPAEERALADVLKAVGADDPEASGSVRLFAGGPVQQELGFVVHSAEYRRGDTIDVDGKIAVTANREILRDIAHGQGPQKSLIAFGYAGWGPGQLEGEMARQDWFTARADLGLVFDLERSRLWDEAMTRRTREL